LCEKVKGVRSHTHRDPMCRMVVETPVKLTARQARQDPQTESEPPGAQRE